MYSCKSPRSTWLWKNIIHVDASKYTLKNFPQDPRRRSPTRSISTGVVARNVTISNITGLWWKDFSPRGFSWLGYDSQSSGEYHSGCKPPVIEGWQFLGAYQNLSTPPEELLWIKHSPNEVLKLGTSGEVFEISSGTRVTQFITSIFHLNTSIPLSEGDVVPYNSTLWYNGTRINLEAPFLGFKTW